MNLKDVLICRNMIPEHLSISAINLQGYLCMYDKALKVFNTKKYFNAVSSVMFWPVDPAKNAIQGDAPEGSDTF